MHASDAPWIPEVAGAGPEVIKMIISNNIMPINSPLMRRTVVDDVGFFDETLRLVEDWDFWIRCALKGKFIQYKNWDGAKALVRLHPSSFSRNRNQVNQSTVLMREKLNRLITDFCCALENKLTNKKEKRINFLNTLQIIYFAG